MSCAVVSRVKKPPKITTAIRNKVRLWFEQNTSTNNKRRIAQESLWQKPER